MLHLAILAALAMPTAEQPAAPQTLNKLRDPAYVVDNNYVYPSGHGAGMFYRASFRQGTQATDDDLRVVTEAVRKRNEHARRPEINRNTAEGIVLTLPADAKVTGDGLLAMHRDVGIRILVLQGVPGIDDAALAELLAVRGKRVKGLIVLDCPDVTGSFLAHADAKLRALVISCPTITDETVAPLTKFRKLKQSLQYLKFENTQVSDAMLDELRHNLSYAAVRKGPR